MIFMINTALNRHTVSISPALLFTKSTLLFCAILIVFGCSSSPPEPSHPQSSSRPAHSVSKPADASTSEINTKGLLTYQKIAGMLRRESSKWVGTPHKMGGTTRNGTDCSGLVGRLYRDLFQIELPRTTNQMVNSGATVKKSELKPGDLIFFHISWRKNHVGIYLGDGEFVHASSKRGVMISNIHEAYWKKNWWTARRVLLTSG